MEIAGKEWKERRLQWKREEDERIEKKDCNVNF